MKDEQNIHALSSYFEEKGLVETEPGICVNCGKSAIAVYTRLMELAQSGAYQERNPDSNYANDRIEESLERPDLSAAVLGLCFRWSDKTTLWTLEPMNEEEKTAFADALRDFAAQEQQTIMPTKEII